MQDYAFHFTNMYSVGSGSTKGRETNQWQTHGAALIECIEDSGVKSAQNHISKHKSSEL